MIERGPIKSYIGITGFVTREEVIEVIKLMPDKSKRLLMVGVLVNWDSLLGFGDNRYPKIESVREIFIDNPLVLNMIHYQTKEPETLCDQLNFLRNIAGSNTHGFQLNNTWPPVKEIYKYKSGNPEQLIVLVITAQAFEDVNYKSNLLVSKITEYKGLIDYILLDQSEGYGKLLDPEFMRIYIEGLKRLDTNICIAGGLDAKNLNIIGKLAKQYPDLSIDAENNLRGLDDQLVLDLAKDYLHGALKLFGEIEK